MKNKVHHFYYVLIVFSCSIVFSSYVNSINNQINFPFQQAGLTEKQAAAHLLSRFTYGAKSGDIENVVKTGLGQWFEKQLEGNLKDQELAEMLIKFDVINFSNTEVENTFPRNAQILRFAIKDGFVNKDSINKSNTKAYRATLAAYMKEKGYRPLQELYRQFINQKVLRASYSNNQLRELMTDFWFNHFNVSLSKNQSAAYIPAFERDVIRPNVFGDFDELLIKTAKAPAMLMYLDNFSSAGINVLPEQKTGMSKNRINPKNKNNKQGLNENYAREVMELHTMGVDGGYTQNDVTQAAKILTGWTIAPMGENGYGSAMKNLIEKVGQENLKKRGFLLDGDFLFAMNRHDNSEKTILGKKFPAGGGYEEGVALLELLAHHRSTAQFIAKKIAIRFVNDNPPQTLVDKMAKTFLSKNGNIKAVLITMVNSPEFWSKEALREKTKSPFELAISAVRGLDAKINQPYQLYTWINKMGQQMYYYQAPTGFPDQGQYWINTGSLLNRMNFGLALASQKIPGVTFNLAALNNNHEPESAEAALLIYSKLLMPERKLEATIARLKPLLTNPNLENSVAKAAEINAPPKQKNTMINEDAIIIGDEMQNQKGGKAILNPTALQKKEANNMLAQVVGVIIGSPEFQRK